MSLYSRDESASIARHTFIPLSASGLAKASCERRLDDLRELNRQFLALLIAKHVGQLGTERWLADTVCHELARLGETQLSALASCPYALFDLDGEYLRCDAGMRAQRYAVDCDDPAVAFARMALFFAWHAVRTDLLFARLALGLGDRTLGWLVATPVTLFAQGSVTQAVAPRWPQHPSFWPDLIRCAAMGQPSLSAAQWVGYLVLAGRSCRSLAHLASTHRERSLRRRGGSG